MKKASGVAAVAGLAAAFFIIWGIDAGFVRTRQEENRRIQKLCKELDANAKAIGLTGYAPEPGLGDLAEALGGRGAGRAVRALEGGRGRLPLDRQVELGALMVTKANGRVLTAQGRLELYLLRSILWVVGLGQLFLLAAVGELLRRQKRLDKPVPNRVE